MPPPQHSHSHGHPPGRGGSTHQTTRQSRQARARHSLDNSNTLDSSEIPMDFAPFPDARRLAQQQQQQPPGGFRNVMGGVDSENWGGGENDDDDVEADEEDGTDVDMSDEDEDDEDDEEEPPAPSPPQNDTTTKQPPSGLKEISSLASWTVSTSKPGCGVLALRNPSSSLFWQSDGPQPHILTIHFFKWVSITHIRIFLDFENDESYTPTRIQFWAGTAPHDLIEFAEMTFEQPRGWIPVDFSGVGPIEDDGDADLDNVDWSKRPELRCFILQVRILENHQNGKDTHLRGLQLFARDERDGETGAGVGDLMEDLKIKERVDIPVRSKRTPGLPKIRKAAWMMEPELR